MIHVIAYLTTVENILHTTLYRYAEPETQPIKSHKTQIDRSMMLNTDNGREEKDLYNWQESRKDDQIQRWTDRLVIDLTGANITPRLSLSTDKHRSAVHCSAVLVRQSVKVSHCGSSSNQSGTSCMNAISFPYHHLIIQRITSANDESGGKVI